MIDGRKAMHHIHDFYRILTMIVVINRLYGNYSVIVLQLQFLDLFILLFLRDVSQNILVNR